MVLPIDRALDYITLIVAILAFITSLTGLRFISKGNLRNLAVGVVVSLMFFSLRKVFDFIGEHFDLVRNDLVWNRLEDVAFLLGLIALLYVATKGLSFFKSISFEKND